MRYFQSHIKLFACLLISGLLLFIGCDSVSVQDENDRTELEGVGVPGESNGNASIYEGDEFGVLTGEENTAAMFSTLIVAPAAFQANPFAPEFIITGAEGSTMGDEHFFPSNENGTFGSTSNIPGLLNVDGMDVVDVDGDGDNDMFICEGNSGDVYLYKNNGSGLFTPAVVSTNVASGGFCTNLRVSDFNEDGAADFVVGDNRVRNGMYVYLQTGAGTFTRVTPGLDVALWSTVGGNSLFGIAAGDIDGDMHSDVLVLGYNGIGAGQVRFYQGNGTGAMAASTLLFNVMTDFGLSGTNGLGLFDLEDDGDLDIIVGGGTGGTHFVYVNDGNGNFTAPAGYDFDLNAQTGIDASDIDRDGDDDLVVAAFGVRSLYYVENLGGSLAPPQFVGSLQGNSIGVGAPPLASVVDIDIVPFFDPNIIELGSSRQLRVAILATGAFDVNSVLPGTVTLGNNDGNDTGVFAYGTGSYKTELRDVNSDGYPDLVLTFAPRTMMGNGDLHRGTTELILNGETKVGHAFQGRDAVLVKG